MSFKATSILDEIKSFAPDILKKCRECLNLSKKDLENIEADSNENLALIGHNIIGDTLKAFVRIALPNIPEEGVEAIKSYLTSTHPPAARPPRWRITLAADSPSSAATPQNEAPIVRNR